MSNQDPQNPENRPGNPGMCSSSSGSDEDGNNSSNDSDETEGQQRQEELQLLQHQQQHLKKPSAAGATAVKTTYKDYSRVPPDAPSKDAPPATLVAAGGQAQQQARKEPTFVVKVHMILNNKKFESIITWLPHGRSWRILRPKEFEEEVIPLYFRHGRYASFMRRT